MNSPVPSKNKANKKFVQSNAGNSFASVKVGVQTMVVLLSNNTNPDCLASAVWRSSARTELEHATFQIDCLCTNVKEVTNVVNASACKPPLSQITELPPEAISKPQRNSHLTELLQPCLCQATNTSLMARNACAEGARSSDMSLHHMQCELMNSSLPSTPQV